MPGVVVAGDPAEAASAPRQTLIASAQPEPLATGNEAGPPAVKGSGPEGGFRWAEALIGAGLVGVLVLGLVKVGGARLSRRD
jgi:hypothetical protein